MVFLVSVLPPFFFRLCDSFTVKLQLEKESIDGSQKGKDSLNVLKEVGVAGQQVKGGDPAR